jgi:hypothetical protein
VIGNYEAVPAKRSRDDQRSASSTVVVIGLGAVGRTIVTSVLGRSDEMSLVGVVDTNPNLIGEDVGTILGAGPLGVPVLATFEEIASQTRVDVAVVATSSFAEVVAPTIHPLVEAGVDVVTICEELVYPWKTHVAVAAWLDEAARDHGVSIVGTGANPGFVLDAVPLLLSAGFVSIDTVEVRRTADMREYDFVVEKLGIGMGLDAFEQGLVDGRVIGHTGFEHAASMLAAGLGWQLDRIEVDPVRPAFVAREERPGTYRTVKRGDIAAVTHSCRAWVRGRERPVIDYVTDYGIFAPDDAVEPGDRFTIVGDGKRCEISVPSGFTSFATTVALAINAIGGVRTAPPGLLNTSDLTIREIAGRGVQSRLPSPRTNESHAHAR